MLMKRTQDIKFIFGWFWRKILKRLILMDRVIFMHEKAEKTF